MTTLGFAQDSAVYDVADVAVDVTADSAAKARDQAIAEAQRTAFMQLLDRLGAPASAGTKLSDNDLATLVQNFEVRNEHASSVRYIGTFAVQFRPSAVRAYLGKRNANFNDAQGQPVLVLPVTKFADRAVMWEEPTRWQKLWSDASRDGGIVPVIIPAGSAEDKPILNTADAISGKMDPIKALSDKYQANGAVVAVLNVPAPGAPYTIDVQHFGGGYDDASDVEHITLPNGTGRQDADDAILMQGIQQVRHTLEKEWRKEPPKAAPVSVDSGLPAAITGNGNGTSWSGDEPPARIPVTVYIQTLAEWADIQRRMMATPGIRQVEVTAMQRGAAQIELGFAGTPQDVQAALAQHNLRLSQDILSGLWTLKNQ